ncbi:alkaline phosphatase D family protein [Pseudomonas sp. L1(2025)]|uniref:alkaline phosphatase D family protein n=1 Tax=Pseudomonas sp. L1(2025) TaxID=3449429 RepID=UPI003F68F3B0
MPQPQTLPAVIAGPMLRRLEPQRLVIWLVGSRVLPLRLKLQVPQGKTLTIDLDTQQCQIVPVGRHAFIHLIDVSLSEALPLDVMIDYDLLVDGSGIAEWAPHLLYANASSANFVLHSRIHQLVHGSCRKPHHHADEGLLCVDRLLADAHAPAERPALLMMSGDQVYADDVAGPMLRAIHALIARLELFDEYLEGAVVDDSASLYGHRASYYHRADLLPALDSNETLRERFFGGVKKPIFTSSTADNHLVTFAEVLAMYLLVWSPTPWTLITPKPPSLSAPEQLRYDHEQVQVDRFRDGLPGVARVFAHLSTLMIFDDHDITDDWNLSAQWEATAYGHPFSNRIIGNALLAYMLCQGWGNQPDVFGKLLEHTQTLTTHVQDNHLLAAVQDELLQTLLKFQHWHYVLPTTPALVVLDTRTRRWRSEFALKQPSGLLDWEALSELQQALLDHPSAIIVSPAPIFGVKLIETVQKVFSWCGYPLLVDAENWMAHRGAAQVILNIFRHSRTPGNYVILSGDVHYSFVYEVLIRHRSAGPKIWQITSSGIKNQFPARLLEWFDRLNRWLYSPRSPLNGFTRRRTMQVVPHIPEYAEAGERLWNSAGIGQVFLNEQGQPEAIYQHNADGRPRTRMVAPE